MADARALRGEAELSEFRSTQFIWSFNDKGRPYKKYHFSYEEWLESLESPEMNPFQLPKTEKRSLNDVLLQVAPDWNRRTKLVSLRLGTMLRIYLSKWFWTGLEWYEAEFVLLLIDRLSEEIPVVQNQPEILTKMTGRSYFLKKIREDEKLPLNLKGLDFSEDWQNLIELIYLEQDFWAVWKLNSVQSFRDFLFVEVTGHEHLGKTGIRKPRIRGYRDGKGSPRDPKLTALARKVDVLFWENRFEERWNEAEREIARLITT